MLHQILHRHPAQDEQLARIENKQDLTLKLGAHLLATLADLKAKVDAQGTVITSAVTLINGISAELKAALASNDPAAVQAIVDELDTQSTELAAAVANNPDPGASVSGAASGSDTTSGASA